MILKNWAEPALLISGNSVLKEVQLIGLKKVRSKASPAVVIENNPKLVGDVEEWYEIAGGANRTRVLFAEVEGTEQADKKPLVFIVLVVVVMMALALTVYWFGWGTRWRRFSGLHEGHTITKAPKKGSKRRTKK
ncbi:unnamed protein product [Heligmosomoides polygyrus]|uniref:Recep_L_domain domain-containing protein n=1 Tax=Heligmosomoides polygyrus TaxID=6339 RepID=A0A3P7Z060_HELPZ|nr:unnamed protein product [Heligmosomoides polygyrus]